MGCALISGRPAIYSWRYLSTPLHPPHETRLESELLILRQFDIFSVKHLPMDRFEPRLEASARYQVSI